MHSAVKGSVAQGMGTQPVDLLDGGGHTCDGSVF